MLMEVRKLDQLIRKKNVFKEYNNKHFNDDFSLIFPLTFIAFISINDPLF